MFKMKIKVAIAVALTAGLLGCEESANSPRSIPDLISADNPTLEAITEKQAFILEDTFGVRPTMDVHMKTEQSIDSNGSFYNNDGVLVDGFTLNCGIYWEIFVSESYRAKVIKHEVLHTTGYHHSDQEINGVQVSEHVYGWY